MATELNPRQVLNWMLAKVKQRTAQGYVRPMYIQGGPGIGKTALVEALGGIIGCKVVTWIAATMDATDLKFPVIIDKELKYVTPSELNAEGKFILFLDELPNAPQSVLNGLQNLVWTRKIGEFKLSDDCIIIAAGNRVNDRAGSGRLNTAMSTRFLKVTMTPDLDDFRAWGIKPRNPLDPKGPTRIHPMLLAFLKFRPFYFYNFDPKKDSFTCPRIHEFISDTMYEGESDLHTKMADYENGGEDFALELIAFEKLYQSAIGSDMILRNPNTCPVPPRDDAAAMWATSTALAWAATPSNLDLVVTYLDRLPEEYAISAMSLIEERNPMVSNTKEFTAFNIAHKKVAV